MYQLLKFIYKKKSISNNRPDYIFQTCKNKNKIPKKVFNNIKKYAKNYKHFIFDDNECEKFIRKYYSDKVVKTFKNLKIGAHKTDLFRYCILYIHGGIYLDIKTELIMPLDDIFKNKKLLYTSISCVKEPSIYQGIIASPPKHSIFLKLIKFMININQKQIIHNDYLIYTKHFYKEIKKKSNKDIVPGLFKKLNIYLFYEKCNSNFIECNGLDRYNLCSFICDKNKKIIKTRFNDYPWK